MRDGPFRRNIRDLTILPFKEFFDALNAAERSVFYILLGAAAVLGLVLGRRRKSDSRGFRSFGAWRFPSFQNSGEELVSRVLLGHFRAPDYHLMNHVTLRMDDGTTQVDYIRVSRFGVFVIETKDYHTGLSAFRATPSSPLWCAAEAPSSRPMYPQASCTSTNSFRSCSDIP